MLVRNSPWVHVIAAELMTPGMHTLHDRLFTPLCPPLSSLSLLSFHRLQRHGGRSARTGNPEFNWWKQEGSPGLFSHCRSSSSSGSREEETGGEREGGEGRERELRRQEQSAQCGETAQPPALPLHGGMSHFTRAAQRLCRMRRRS